MTSHLREFTEIQYVKGVGPHLGDLLRKRGITCVRELLEWFPRAYEDHRAARSISSLQPNETVSLTAHVERVSSFNMGRSRRKIYEILVSDETGRIACKYFRNPYKGYFEQFQVGLPVKITGKVILYRGQSQFQHPEVHLLNTNTPENNKDELVPIYTETEGLRASKLRKIIQSALEGCQTHLTEPLPPSVLKKYNLMSRQDSLRQVHNPPVEEGEKFIDFKSEAQRRLIFEEFFWLNLHLARKKLGVQEIPAPPMLEESERIKDLLDSLDFELTKAQERTFAEIKSDLQKPQSMHRLVQGDVGCGKTLVAFLAALHAAANGFQTALMAPTEVLAEQHYANAVKLLSPLGIQVLKLTGAMKKSEREAVIAQLMSGHVSICIGTHALIQKDVEFGKLGLVIIDEQHRFGVKQRQLLQDKGDTTHFLVMTATPIPRTLALTAYGDMDVSIIDEMPPGRIPIVTRTVFDNRREKVMGFLEEQLQAGRQAYFIYPLMEESEKMDLKDAQTACQIITERFPEVSVELVHGKMKSEEKKKVMTDFKEGAVDILVATTVVEVGVDVPNANMMIIEHAERFGLSQLHQLRGRVGRGDYKSYCVLMLGYAVSEEGRQRAQIMESTTDGFKIAEADLEMRGPGQFLGEKQSGLVSFRLAHLVRDVLILQQAREAAFDLIAKDPHFTHQENTGLSKELKDRSLFA